MFFTEHLWTTVSDDRYIVSWRGQNVRKNVEYYHSLQTFSPGVMCIFDNNNFFFVPMTFFYNIKGHKPNYK